MPTKFKRGERGSVKADKNEANEKVHVTENFTAGRRLEDHRENLHRRLQGARLKKLETTTLAILEFKFNLPQYSADCEICDVQIVPVAAK